MAQIVAVLAKVTHVFEHLVDGRNHLVLFGYRKTPTGKQPIRFALPAGTLLGKLSDAVREHRQRPGCRNLRIFLPQRSCGSVARISKDVQLSRLALRLALGQRPIFPLVLLINLGALLVQFIEFLDPKEYFAPDLEHLGPIVALQVLRDDGDGADVGSDFLADDSVASRGGRSQNSISIYEVN